MPVLPPSLRIACLVLLAAVSGAGVATAQSRTATFGAVIAGTAKLSISPASIAFPDSDPTSAPMVAAQPGPVTITVKTRATQNATVNLTVRASDDLRSGINTIPASTISWTAAGPGFAAGSLGVSAQTVATWIGSGVQTGTQSFMFANSWSYAVGTYTLTMLYTVSSP